MLKESKRQPRVRRERERGIIPPPFTVSIEELYSILEVWVRYGVVVLPKCKCEPTDEKNKNKVHFAAGTIGGMITKPWIVMP